MHCVIITAYKGAAELRQCLKRLGDSFLIYVHIDKKSLYMFENVMHEFKNVHFFSNYDVKWGGIEHLNAILDLLKASVTEDWEYVHIISGEDYPLATADEIYSSLKNENKIYTVSCKDYDGRRYKYYWPYVKYSWNYKNSYIRLISLFLIGVQTLLPFTEKKGIGEFCEIYQGLIWGSYPRYAIQYCLDYINVHPEYMNDLRTCKIPEEFFFQTLLENSSYKHKIANFSYRYMRWPDKCGWGPVYLDQSDISCLKESKDFFIRKVKNNDATVQWINANR